MGNCCAAKKNTSNSQYKQLKENQRQSQYEEKFKDDEYLQKKLKSLEDPQPFNDISECISKYEDAKLKSCTKLEARSNTLRERNDSKDSKDSNSSNESVEIPKVLTIDVINKVNKKIEEEKFYCELGF